MMIFIEQSLPKYAALCVVSLFLGIRYQAGVVLRPFDALVGIGGVLLVGRASVRGRIDSLQKNPVYVLFLFTYGYRCLNALFLSGIGTAVKETIQIIEFIVLIHLIAIATRNEENRREFFRMFLIGLGALSLVAAGWHVGNGIYAGYKELGAPKYAFSMFALLAAMAHLRKKTTFRKIVLIAAVLLTLLSGERKGWVALAGAFVMMYFVFQGRSILSILSKLFQPRVLLGGGLVVGIGIFAALQFEYVAGQIQSMYDLYLIASNASLQMDLSRFDTSGSNLARFYVLLFTIRTTLAHPFFGVGTGRWHDALAEAAQAVNSQYLIGAHSEYQRLSVENGLIGLGMYITTWLVALRASIYRFGQASDSLQASILTVIGLIAFGAVINLFLGGGALNVVYMALAVGLLLGLKNDSRIVE